VERFSALIGFFLILAIAYALSNNRKAIQWRTVFWGLLLQIITAILVLKGVLIATALEPIQLPLTRAGAALVFIVLAILLFQIAKRLPETSRKPLWITFGVVALYLFLTYNLLAF